MGASCFTLPHCNHGNLPQAKGVYERDNSFPRAQNLVCKISRNLKGLRMMKRRRLCSRRSTAASPSSVSLGQHSIRLHFQPICHRMSELRRALDLSSEPELLTLTRERRPLAAKPSLHTESRCAVLWMAPQFCQVRKRSFPPCGEMLGSFPSTS